LLARSGRGGKPLPIGLILLFPIALAPTHD
jgi:hypothetical protein